MADLGKVAVLSGGSSSERNVSLAAGRRVVGSLNKQGVNAHLFDPALRPITDLKSEGFTRAYFALFGKRGEDGLMQGTLEMLNIPYTGSGVLASAISMNKVMTKQIWSANGLRSAPYRVVRREEMKNLDFAGLLKALGGTVILKPIAEGTSLGVSKANSVSELKDSLATAFENTGTMLIERFISGREFTVGSYRGNVLPIVEIVVSNDFLFNDSAAKESDSSSLICPAKLEPNLYKECLDIVSRAVEVIGIHDVARVDIILGEDGKFYLLEINSCPNIGNRAALPIMLEQADISYDSFTLYMLEAAKVGKY